MALAPPRAWAGGVVSLSPALPSLRAGFLPQVKVSYFESQQAAALAHSVLYLTAVGESCSCLAVDTVAIGCGEGGRKLWSLGGEPQLPASPLPWPLGNIKHLQDHRDPAMLRANRV